MCQSYDITENSKFQTLKSVTISGRLCTVGTVFLRRLPTSESNAVFFRIAEAMVSGKVFFVMEELHTVLFCQDRFSFIVSPLNTFIFVSLNDLVFDVPLHSFYYDNEIHVSPNYYHIF